MKALIVVFLVVVTAGAVAPQHHYGVVETNDHVMVVYCKDGSEPHVLFPKDLESTGHPEILPAGVMVGCK